VSDRAEGIKRELALLNFRREISNIACYKVRYGKIAWDKSSRTAYS